MASGTRCASPTAAALRTAQSWQQAAVLRSPISAEPKEPQLTAASLMLLQAGFTKGKSELEVNRYREAELTHGRVGMLAAAGFLVQEKFHPLFSGDGGAAIDQIPQLPVWLWVVMGGGIAAAEAARISIAFRELDGEKLKAETALRPGYVPGDLGFDPLDLAPKDPAEFAFMQEKELAHARIGMIAAATFLLQEGVTKQTWGTTWGLPDF